MKERKIIIGTHNPGKLEEYRILLRDMGYGVFSLNDLDIEKDVQESGKTYQENAVKKAVFYSRLTELPVLTDDGGLEIDILGGEPGLKSRRWPGYKASDEELIEFALGKLNGVPREKRTARFVVIVALAFSKNKIFTARGEKEDIILEKPQGEMIPGYPFRSLFYLPDQEKTFNELSLEEELQIGHRKKALDILKPKLQVFLKKKKQRQRDGLS